MRRVYPPSGEADRSSECLGALEPALAQLIDRAEGAGWTRDESLRAICVLVWRMIRPDEDPSVQAA